MWRPSCLVHVNVNVTAGDGVVIAVEYFLFGERRAGGKVDCCVSFSCGSIIFLAWGQKGRVYTKS